MDHDQHRAWLAELAAEDLRRRREAEPDFARREATLRLARESLARSESANRELEAVLDAHLHPADDIDDG